GVLVEQGRQRPVAVADEVVPQGFEAVEALAKLLVLLLEAGEGGGDAVAVLAAHLLADELQQPTPRLPLAEAPVEVDGVEQLLAQGYLGELAVGHGDEGLAEFLERC